MVFDDQFEPKQGGQFETKWMVKLYWNKVVNLTVFSNITTRTLTSLQYDIFTTNLITPYAQERRVFGVGVTNTFQHSTNYDQPGFNTNGNLFIRYSHVNNPTHSYYGQVDINNVYTANDFKTSHIMYTSFLDTMVKRAKNGHLEASARHNAIGMTYGGHIFGANNSPGDPIGDDNNFFGDFGDMIIYGHGTVTTAERNKIESYMAIKYGLTLHHTNNYTSSRDDVVWDAVANANYYHNVAGIANDFYSALEQKQSTSQLENTNSQLIIGLGAIAIDNFSNTNNLSDEQFLIWGDNDIKSPMSGNADSFTKFDYSNTYSTINARRMNRVWKAQNTDVTQQVLMRFPIASVGTTTLDSLNHCAEYVLVMANDELFTTNVRLVPLTINGDDYDALNIFQNGITYFTYARVPNFPLGAVILPNTIHTTPTHSITCEAGPWQYARNTSDNNEKLLGLSEFTATQLGTLTTTITPTGAAYSNASVQANLMPRVAHVSSTGSLTQGKVRVYYSATEMANTLVPSAQTNSWFFYDGAASDAIADINTDGRFVHGEAQALTPDATGTEDGVAYVEFHNINPLGSFVYVSSSEIIAEVLPVKLLTFSATLQQNNVLLTWKTASEQNNKGFEVQHSTDSRNWTTKSFVTSMAENGNSSAMLAYDFLDTNPVNGKNFYRLQQVDYDGKFDYSKTEIVTLEGNGSRIRLYPNPTTSEISVEGLCESDKLTIVNVLGASMFANSLIMDDNKVNINVASFAPGVYFLVVNNSANGNTTTLKFLKK